MRRSPSRHDILFRHRSLRAGLAPFLTVLVGLAAVPISAQTSALGPLVTEDSAPLHRVTLTAPSEAADPVPEGTVEWDIWLGYSNIFEQDSTGTHVLMVDMERLISTTGVRVGLSDRLEVGGRITLETTGPGALDGFVSWWHGRLGVGNANREHFPEGGYDQRLEDGDGTVVLDVPRRTLGLEDVRFFGKARLVGGPDEGRALSLRLTARIPAVRDPLVRERPDAGLSLLARLSGSNWHGHAMLGATTVRAVSRDARSAFRSRAYHGMVAAERRIGDGLSALIQYQVSSPVLRSFEDRELDGVSANLAFGVVGQVGQRWRWDLSFQEDVPADTPAADFTLGLRLSRSW